MATPTRSSRRSVRPRPARPPERVRRGRPAAGPPPPRPVADPRLLEGVALFNHHRFFECHEVLEQLWRDTTGRPRDFYKGLIQAAVACYHWSRGNLAGAHSLFRSSSRYLARYAPSCLGVDVAGFLAQYRELFGWLRRHPQRYDERLIPVLRWLTPPARS